MIRPSIHLFSISQSTLRETPYLCIATTTFTKATKTYPNPGNKEIMPIDIIHPHISHHDNYFIINNPAIYRTNLLQFLQSCIGSPKPAFQTQPPRQPLTRSSSSSEITLLTTGPSAPNITLTPSAALFGGGAIADESAAQDTRFLSVPGVDLVRRMVRERRKERQREIGCEGNYRCRCRGCGKKRIARIAAIKRRRERREREEGEGERSEVEG